MKKLMLVLLVALTALTMVFAAGAKEAQKTDEVTLRWAYWGGEARIERSEAAIKIFEAQNPGVKVHQEPSGGAGDHFVKVDTQVAAGAGPDVINMGGNFPDYIPGGPKGHLTLDLFPYGASGVINLDVIDPGAIAYATVDGALYGLSTGANMPALVYNKSMIERAGVALPVRNRATRFGCAAEFDAGCRRLGRQARSAQRPRSSSPTPRWPASADPAVGALPG